MAAAERSGAVAAVLLGGLAVGWAWRTYLYDREKMEEDTRRIRALAVLVAEEEIQQERKTNNDAKPPGSKEKNG